MVSTFYGLEIAKRGMTAQQAALYTTGHNIANANTPGYSRQRVNFEQTAPYPSPSVNQPKIPGQIGTGVQPGSIQRMRDSFIDDQYRGENNKLGYWASRNQALSSMESIMNEPTDMGLANTLDQFWTSLQDLSLTPKDSGARSVVRQRGIYVAETFNYAYDSLKSVQEDYKNEINVSQKAINSLLTQINEVNQQIGDVEVHGSLPNDLYDQRDRLIDDLSTYVNIKVIPSSSGGLSSKIAEGKFDVYLADNNGNILRDDAGKQIRLINSQTRDAYGIHINYDSSKPDGLVNGIKIMRLDPNGDGYEGFVENPYDPAVTPNYSFASFETFKDKTSGSLSAVVEAYGYNTTSNGPKGLYPDMMKKLDEMAFTFVQKFNEIHRSGWSMTELQQGTKNGKDFFSFDSSVGTPSETDPTGAAKSLRVSQIILDSTDNIAAAAEGTTISVSMVKNSANNSGTTGNPEITGRIEFPTGATKMDVEVQRSGNTWTYKITTPTGTGNTNGALTVTNNIAELPGYPGVKIDLSDISNVQTGDKWTVSIPNNGGITPADEAFEGNGSNAAALANVKDAVLKYGTSTTTVTSFYQSIIGDMGVKASQAKQMVTNTETLKESALTRRDSVSAVSLDEEMTNMIKFQHAYNAAARNITMVDEMLDRIINNMGLAGR